MAEQAVAQPPGQFHVIRLFASAADERRVRRRYDGIVLVVALAALALLAWWAVPTRTFESAIVAGAASSPDWLRSFWVLVYDLTLTLPLLLAGAAIARRRWPIVLQSVLAAAAALVLVLIVSRLNVDAWASVEEAAGLGDSVKWPAAALAVAASALLAASTDVTRTARTFGQWGLVVGGLAAVLAGRTTPTGALASLIVGVAAAAVARLAIGTTAGHLSPADLRSLLAALGAGPIEVVGTTRRSDGLVLVDARGDQGERLLVKVRGRDAAESRRLERLWRALAYRDGGAALEQVRSPGLEREALATLLAAARGVPVWPVATGGRPQGGDEALVLRVEGTRASELPEGAFDDAAADAAWRACAQLHAARTAHLGLTPSAIALRDDGTVALTDFTDAAIAASEEALLTDDAQLHVSLAVLLDRDRAIAAAQRALDDERLGALLGYLQQAALPRDLRGAAKAAKLDVDDLRSATAAAAGVESPELVKLRRVSWASLLQTALLALAAAVIIPFLANVDVDELRASLESASWTLIVAGFIVAQLPRLAQTVSTLGSVPVRLPFGPTYALQLATSFLNVALPSGAARMAVNVRFFQRQGLAPATAVASGLIDSFVGNVIQVVLLVSLLVFGSFSIEMATDTESTGTGVPTEDLTLIGLIVAACLAAVLICVLVGRIRRMIVRRAREWWPQVRASARPLRDGKKLLQLIGGNLVAELLFATSLALFVYALGGDITLVAALFVNMAASLLVMFIPIPGGIGVSEGALIFGLTGVGVDEQTAVAATLLYRLSVFYLPPIWGWFAMRWLTSNRYL